MKEKLLTLLYIQKELLGHAKLHLQLAGIFNPREE
jgi:hypothetical protein